MSKLSLDEIIQQEAPKFAKQIIKAAEIAHNEAEFRTPVTRLIEDFAEKIDLTLNVREEYTLINGRADAVYNRFVVEYEPPGSLRKSNGYRSNQHAITQVKDYIEGLHRIERHRKERIAGVAMDGSWFIVVRYKNDIWNVDDPVLVTPESTERFLRYLSSLSTEKALTPDNLVRDFGENTTIGRLCVSTLYDALTNSNNKKAKAIYNQWGQQFSQTIDYKEATTKLKVDDLAKRYGVKAKSVDPFILFFVIHSYYAAFIKLLAVQIASFYAMPKIAMGLAHVATYSSDKLHKYLKDMERGGIFKTYLNINNFLEGDFFGWYLEIWDENLDKAFRRTISELGNYSLVTLDVDPEETRDLLKKLYQHLMPREIRHDLGEYYTPDWLAERLLNQLEGGRFKGDPNKRLLDPACGSGTFLILAIRKIRQYCQDEMIPEHVALEKILSNVVGIDLNPLAVISARTNYLLALGELLKFTKEPINIPIYLADSILTPGATEAAEREIKEREKGQLSFDIRKEVPFKTSVGTFSIPKSLVSAQYVDQLANFLEEAVDIKLSQKQFQKRVLEFFPLDESKDERDLEILDRLYVNLLDLDQKGINGIWARIIKNAFAPLFVGEFDYIAGNPPWVNWESLPDDYRLATKPLWERQGLFPHGGMDTILGKGKKDISTLMTFVAMESYLKRNGRLGFVITQSVFKTSGAGQGFRRFKLADGTPIRVVTVDDLVELKPFEGVANRTSIVILQKGRATKYPVTYNFWKKRGKGKSIGTDFSLEKVTELATYRQFYAEPVDEKDITSAWITGKQKTLKAIRKVIGKSDYEAHAGAYTGGANGIYWVNIVSRRPDGLVVISNITEGAKREVENLTATIELDLLYPLLRGRDVQRWRAEPSAYIIMVQDPIRRRGFDENKIKDKYPKTYGYLKRFEGVLLERAAYKRYFRESDAFYTMFDVGEYTFAPWKVVWPWISVGIRAAVVATEDGKTICPEHNTSFVDSDREDEAYFICGLLNSAVGDFSIRAFYSGGGGGIASPSVLQNIYIPKFDPKNNLHLRIAELSQKAHKAAKRGEEAAIGEIEEKIDELAANLWRLSDDELREIKASLEELND